MSTTPHDEDGNVAPRPIEPEAEALKEPENARTVVNDSITHGCSCPEETAALKTELEQVKAKLAAKQDECQRAERDVAEIKQKRQDP